ncbi:hypothetical protein [Actinokineospora fastidiosa]|uniref:hypothetical protein n=1 Tax=Actinokineospora fastidiosa TaxID=1816 RepID=UPI00166F7C49|nr:hypothetical protein [Actinokineospora fastidiosa]
MDRVVLTFAEMAFLLSVRQAPVVRTQVLAGYPEGVEAAGESSLLARGLCEMRERAVVPGQEVLTVLAGLTTATTRVRAVAWTESGMRFAHLFFGPHVALAVLPFAGMRFDVRVLGAPLGEQVIGFVDAHLAPTGPVAILVEATTGESTTSMSVTVDESGDVTVSDSQHSPDRGAPVPRAAALDRMAQVFGMLP